MCARGITKWRVHARFEKGLLSLCASGVDRKGGAGKREEKAKKRRSEKRLDDDDDDDDDDNPAVNGSDASASVDEQVLVVAASGVLERGEVRILIELRVVLDDCCGIEKAGQ
jgi:hypothetical protein